MKIGIDASRAFLKNKTGIEEYSFQIISYLIKNFNKDEIVLYLRKRQSQNKELLKLNFGKNVKIKEISFFRFWTQVGLSLELLISPVDTLFVPAHTIPWIHPKNTVVTIHGLEYEHCPESYSLYSRIVHRFFIKKSCYWARKIIAVSKKTKNDLVDLYKVPINKIEIIYNGFCNENYKPQFTNYKSISNLVEPSFNFILYIGRIEKRKNIEGIIKAFEILKEEYAYQGKLILAGRPGYGYSILKFKIQNSKFKKDILEKGFIESKEKWNLLQKADIFLFPSFSEGFGIPILEAQSIGAPVITSNYGPMDEVAGDKNSLVNPKDPKAIAQLASKLITNKKIREETIKRGLKNVQKFSWQKSGEETRKLLSTV